MKIAVTGGSGGLGRAIVADALSHGFEVVSIDRVLPEADQSHQNLTFVQADICDYDQMVEAFFGCDALIHMAAIPNPLHDPDHIVHNNNVVGSYNAMRAAVENKIMRICQASSVNAIGFSFSRESHFDYFPLDENHANYNEDSYSLSKWICEQQADSFARRYEDIHISSMRFPLVVRDRGAPDRVHHRYKKNPPTHIWSYVLHTSAARACVASLSADFKGHEVFYIAAADTNTDEPSLDLAAKYFADIPIQGDLSGGKSFISTEKAERMLDWKA